MEQEEQEVALYDFLYRDSSRITSYYAQIFSGHLTTLEETDSERDSQGKGAKLSIHLASGDVKSTQESLRSQKRIINPHDLTTVDVLSFFNEKNRTQTDIELASHGSLIVAKGTVLFIDSSMMLLAVAVLEMEAENKRKTARTPSEKAAAQNLKQITQFMSKVIVPSGFLLQTEAGLNIAGTLKDDGMEEPISTYYFKHGTAGLASVYLLGIKEEPAYSVSLPTEQMIGAGQAAAAGLRSMIFPPDAVMVTPIALFREI